jgi:hypothetical protein
MQANHHPDDIWYALANTEVVVAPQKRLETFGTTVIHYHLVAEKMDAVNEIRVREGRIHAERPQVLTPAYFERVVLEGFQEEAQEFVQWLREHVQDLTFLKYGFRFKKEEIQESTIHENFEVAVERVKARVESQNDPFSAVIKGVDDAWETCLLKFTTDTIRNSAPGHVAELKKFKKLEQIEGIARSIREEIDSDFETVGTDRSKMKTLGEKLRHYGIFEPYEDRFYELVRRLSR